MRIEDWPLYRYRASMVKTIDGDTCEVSIDFGDRTYRRRRIRLLGYDAPELFHGDNRDAGRAARDALATLLPAGSLLYIETELDRTSFDRLLARVYFDAGSGELRDVADEMVASGHGVPA